MAIRERLAARGLVLDELGNVLLVHFTDRARGSSWWATPGGAVERGETHQEALRRELREETGLVVDQIGPWIWTRRHEGVVVRGTTYVQVERFYLVRVRSFEAMATELDPGEDETFGELRWWALSELRATTDELSPRNLAQLVDEVLSHGPAPRPQRVGV